MRYIANFLSVQRGQMIDLKSAYKITKKDLFDEAELLRVINE
tara:strand:- start:73 stop:198 length:126 start_codon:yes stop_codon:yes gene_type:complete